MLLSAAILLTGCGLLTQTGSPVPSAELEAVHYSGTSFWYDPLPPGAEPDPDSGLYIDALVTEHRRSPGSETLYELLVIVNGGTTPVYVAAPDDRRISIPITTMGYGAAGLQNIPFPEYTFPDPATDGHCVIVDPAAELAFDFWQLRTAAGRWVCSAAAISSLTGTGVHDKAFSVTASGFALPAGIIWPEELTSTIPGAINHALVFGYPLTRLDSYVSPAARSDGWSTDPAALPLGAHLQLDPDLDLSSLDPPLSNAEMRVAEALQTYGMYLYDTGSQGSIVELDAVGTLSFSDNPYLGITRYSVEGGYIDIGNIPLDRMRVLKLGEISLWGDSYPTETAFGEYYFER